MYTFFPVFWIITGISASTTLTRLRCWFLAMCFNFLHYSMTPSSIQGIARIIVVTFYTIWPTHCHFCHLINTPAGESNDSLFQTGGIWWPTRPRTLDCICLQQIQSHSTKIHDSGYEQTELFEERLDHPLNMCMISVTKWNLGRLRSSPPPPSPVEHS